MDYGKFPLHKRTRHQVDLFYRRFFEERQKVRGESSRRREHVNGVQTEGLGYVGRRGGIVYSDSFTVSVDCESDSDDMTIGENGNAKEEDVGHSVNSKRDSRKGKNVVENRRRAVNDGVGIGVNATKILDSSRGTKRKNIVGPRAVSKRRESRKGMSAVEIIGDDADESSDDVEYLGERVDSKSASGSKQGFENCDFIDVEEAASSSVRRGKGNVAEPDGRKKGCTSAPCKAQSRVWASRKNKVAIEEVSVELDDSEESESFSESEDDSTDEDYTVENEEDLRLDDEAVDDEESFYSSDKDELYVEDEKGEDKGDKFCNVERKRVSGKGKETIVETGNKKNESDQMVNSRFVKEFNPQWVDGSSRYDSGTVKTGRVDTEIREISTIRKVAGFNMVVDSEPKEDTKGRSALAKRLRSSSISHPREKLKLGTVSCPLPVDEELDPSSGEEDNCTEHRYNDVNDGKNCKRFDGKEKLKSGKLTGSKKLPKDYDFIKILADSIWEEGDQLLEKFSSGDKAEAQEGLPLKFRFEDECPIPPEKPAWQAEIDDLFAEMEMALRSCEIGSTNSYAVNIDGSISTETDTPATLCKQGVHQLILDEEIGIMCKFCSYVHLEIKHISPTFSKHPLGRRNNRDSCIAGQSMFDDLELQGSRCNDLRSVHDKGTVWDIVPCIKNSLYPHQQEGFEFMWKNVAGDIRIENLKKPLSTGGSGCIISHAPGTGKTRLTIVFLQTFLELYPNCQPVIMAPRSMLLTWKDEFLKWNVNVPFHILNIPELSGHESTTAANLLKKFGNRSQKSKAYIRMVKLYSWTKGRSILGISYRLFEQLAGEGEKKREVNRWQDEQIKTILLERPGLLVLDEGHTPRNDHSLIWKALSKIETPRRIILSGTPFQNNFAELYNTLCLVNPKFADRISSQISKDYGKRCCKKSNAGRLRWTSMMSTIGRNADELEKLREMIDPFVHVHNGNILQENIPGLRNSVVVLKPTELQKELFRYVEGRYSRGVELDHPVSLISVYPSLLLNCNVSGNEDFSVYKGKLEKLKMEPEAGVKFRFLIELIRLSEALKEKVLVFGQYIDPLNFIKKQLLTLFDWTEGRELLYMDGHLDEKQRQSSINSLNDPTSEARVLVASIRACSEGINLVGASRVVLLDAVWNPSVERQAISRAYRLGQKKLVYIYHLITSGTMEGEKYLRQVEKDRLSKLVFSSSSSSAEGGGDDCQNHISSTVSEDKILDELIHHDKLTHLFEKILYQPKQDDLLQTFGVENTS